MCQSHMILCTDLPVGKSAIVHDFCIKDFCELGIFKTFKPVKRCTLWQFFGIALILQTQVRH